MSVMVIDDHSRERLYKNKQYNLEVTAYSLNSYISRWAQDNAKKAAWYINKDILIEFS